MSVILTVALMVTGAYLLRTRREDNERDISDIKRDMARLSES